MEQVPRKTSANMAVSVVSHGHDAQIADLLAELARTGAGVIGRVILTHNLRPAGDALASTRWPFELLEIVNERPQGYGRNHNCAASHAGDASLLAVLNPDVSWQGRDLWEELRTAASAPGAGCVFPRLLNADGSAQDQVRSAVTPWALVRRRLLRLTDTHADWVSAAFWVTPVAVFRAMKGFDERYFMYCEDVDFCLRLHLQGWRLQGVGTCVLHDARRASHSDARHFGWHLRSLLRLWCSGVLWRYLWRRKTARFSVRLPGTGALATDDRG